ncbi:MAG: hypothetical protein AABX17_03315 [Nanoarchaeota archaeon]
MAKKRVQKEKSEEKTNLKTNFFKENSIVFGTIIVVAVIVIAALLIIRTANHFEYNGVEFNKRNSGDIVLYTAKIPVEDYYGNILEYRQVDFRNKPQALEGINMYNGTIKILDADLTYISYGNLNSCEDTILAGADLGIFLATIGVDYKAAVDDITYKNSTNTPYVNCNTNPLNTVIYIHSGNETKITKRMLSCYDIQYKDCDILPAVEKFELTMLEQYMDRI